jgi:hypothetical protein
MSEAISGVSISTRYPACRSAHAGYVLRANYAHIQSLLTTV